MSNKKIELFSGRVKKTPSTQVSPDRYSWLKLSEAEPDLGVPLVSGALLISTTTGTRSWTQNVVIDDDVITTAQTDTDLELSANGAGLVSILKNTSISGTLSSLEAFFSSANVLDLTEGQLVAAGVNGRLISATSVSFDGENLNIAGDLNVGADLRVNGEFQAESIVNSVIDCGNY